MSYSMLQFLLSHIKAPFLHRTSSQAQREGDKWELALPVTLQSADNLDNLQVLDRGEEWDCR